jgi:DNA mismatch repair protein MutS2
MEAATPDSLILLDEVGAGTDPTEGSALGMSVLRRLAGSASLTMATTHHGQLRG